MDQNSRSSHHATRMRMARESVGRLGQAWSGRMGEAADRLVI
ncbi:unnamed protein product [[Actinomadura] parvosata subsp. kistnae]|nr:unnamed protein product [Actinomadura parvosata subsp. kistnae]